MAHELADALQQAGRIRQRCAVKEPHVYVRTEYTDVAEGRISQTCNRTAVMQKLPDFVPTFSHHLKPLTRDGSQSTCMLFHPHIDGGIPLDSTVESQQICSHRRSTFWFRDLWLHNGRFARHSEATAGNVTESPDVCPRSIEEELRATSNGLLIPQSDHGVNAHGAARGQVSSNQTDRDHY